MITSRLDEVEVEVEVEESVRHHTADGQGVSQPQVEGHRTGWLGWCGDYQAKLHGHEHWYLYRPAWRAVHTWFHESLWQPGHWARPSPEKVHHASQVLDDIRVFSTWLLARMYGRPHMHSTRLWYTFSTITRNREMESRPKCNSSKSFFKFWGTLTGTSILSQFTGQFESKICTTSFEMSAILIWVNWLWMREWNILVTKLNKSLWTNFWLSHLISNHWSTSMLLLDY